MEIPKKKVAVIIAGCGNKDGGEIHENTLTLLELDRAGLQAICFAPDKEQMEVIDYLTGTTKNEKRNVLAESARIARGKIYNLKEFKANEVDALIIPGGQGAAKNLCDFASKGENCHVEKDVERAILEMFKAKKPIGAICIAPVLLAKVLGSNKIKITIGNDKKTVGQIELMGAIHENCAVNTAYVDDVHKIITTPAYMLANRISEVHDGITVLVQKLNEMIQN